LLPSVESDAPGAAPIANAVLWGVVTAGAVVWLAEGRLADTGVATAPGNGFAGDV